MSGELDLVGEENYMKDEDKGITRQDKCLHLTDLPPELLMNIFAFIDIRSLFSSVVCVCKLFHECLSGEGLWKTLFALKWSEHSIVADLEYVCDWRDVCLVYEDVDHFWSGPSKGKAVLRTEKVTGHYGSVDSAYIMPSGSFCVSGSRDRTAAVWDIRGFIGWQSDSDTKSCARVLQLTGHQGWVWSIGAEVDAPNLAVTTSWDKSVRVWDLAREGENISTFEYHPAAVLNLVCKDGLYFTGCYDRMIRVFDPASGNVVLKNRHHSRPVLSLIVTDHFIITGSEDKSIGIFDVRMNKLYAQITTDTPVICMNTAREQGFSYLRAGGKCGSFYVYDMAADRFTLLNATDLWSDYKLTQLCNFSGAMAACSQDGSVRFYTPDRATRLIERRSEHTGDVASAHCRGGVLVTGSSDNSVVLWKFFDA